QRHREGYPLGGFWAVDVLRDANGTPVLDANGRVQADLTCSWPDPVDPNGYGGSCHEKYVGPSSPTREFGLSNSVTLFGNLRLFANLDYKGGHYLVCAICSIRNRINTNTWRSPILRPIRSRCRCGRAYRRSPTSCRPTSSSCARSPSPTPYRPAGAVPSALAVGASRCRVGISGWRRGTRARVIPRCRSTRTQIPSTARTMRPSRSRAGCRPLSTW